MIRVVKIGGNVVDDEKTLAEFACKFAAIPGPKVLVHGGGVMASRIQKAMGMEPVMVQGRRVTDENALQIVTMVYAGWCNKHITALLQGAGCNAVGLSGCDGNAITASHRAPKMINGQEVDYGLVGDVKPESVNAGFLKVLLDGGLTPILCAINHDGKGSLLNTNADTIASSVAVALSAVDSVKLYYCFEKPGVLADKDDDSSLIANLDKTEFQRLKNSGAIDGGMVPKLENAFAAIASGVESVKICHALEFEDSGTVLH